jgi:DnaJ-class molecular chaperone
MIKTIEVPTVCMTCAGRTFTGNFNGTHKNHRRTCTECHGNGESIRRAQAEVDARTGRIIRVY